MSHRTGTFDSLLGADPQEIVGDAGAFEEILGTGVLAFIGMNLFIAGTLVLSIRFDSFVWIMKLVILLVIAGLWAFLKGSKGIVGFHAGGFITALSILLSGFGVISLVPSAILATALIVLIRRRRLTPSACYPYTLYIPVHWAQTLPADVALFFGGGILLVMVIAFLLADLWRAALASVFGGSVLGWILLFESHGPQVALAGMLGVFVLATVAYELRLPLDNRVSLRGFINQGIIPVLGLPVIPALVEPYTASHHWIWASLVSLYMGIVCLLKPATMPTRLVWIVLALLTAIWITPGWGLQPIITLLFAGILGLLGARIGQSFLSTAGMLVASPLAIHNLVNSTEVVRLDIAFSAVLHFAFFTLIALSRPAKNSAPLWYGFVRESHAAWIGQIAMRVNKSLVETPVIGLPIKAVTKAITWFRFLRGRGNPCSLSDVSFAVGQVYFATVLANQLILLSLPKDHMPVLSALIIAPVFVIWGSALVIAGRAYSQNYWRLLGLTLISVPIIHQAYWFSMFDLFVCLYVSVYCGFGYWISSLVIDRIHPTVVP